MPGTLQAGGALFASTHWSMVVEAGDAHSQVAEQAPADLCRCYWPPVYTFVRRRGHPAADAQDLTQAFFAFVLEKRVYTRADPDRGRFRTFLLTALKHFLADARARTQALKRGDDDEFLPLSEELLATEAAAFIAQVTLTTGAPEEWEFYAKAVKANVEFGVGSPIFPVIVRP